MIPFLSSLWSFALAHPELLWLVLTALVSLFHFAIEPHFPRLVAFLRATGLDLPRLWAILRGLEPKLPPLPPVVGALAFMIFMMLGGHVIGCSAAQVGADVTAVEDVSNAVCQELEANLQTDPAWLQFVCSVVPNPGATPKTFRVRVAKASASKFAEDHCVKAGSGAPTP